MNIKTCIFCKEDFDLTSPAKIKVGGLVTTCVDCSEEDTVKYLGVAVADGKQGSIEVLAFNTDKDRSKYSDFWKNNIGMNKGKSCHLSRGLSTDPGIKFKTVIGHTPANHKGKL